MSWRAEEFRDHFLNHVGTSEQAFQYAALLRQLDRQWLGLDEKTRRTGLHPDHHVGAQTTCRPVRQYADGDAIPCCTQLLSQIPDRRCESRCRATDCRSAQPKRISRHRPDPARAPVASRRSPRSRSVGTGVLSRLIAGRNASSPPAGSIFSPAMHRACNW